MQPERAAAVVDAVDAIIVGLAVPLAREHVNFVPAPDQRGGQFRDMDADAADSDGVERFPRKQGNAHRADFPLH